MSVNLFAPEDLINRRKLFFTVKLLIDPGKVYIYFGGEYQQPLKRNQHQKKMPLPQTILEIYILSRRLQTHPLPPISQSSINYLYLFPLRPTLILYCLFLSYLFFLLQYKQPTLFGFIGSLGFLDLFYFILKLNLSAFKKTSSSLYKVIGILSVCVSRGLAVISYKVRRFSFFA